MLRNQVRKMKIETMLLQVIHILLKAKTLAGRTVSPMRGDVQYFGHVTVNLKKAKLKLSAKMILCI